MMNIAGERGKTLKTCSFAECIQLHADAMTTFTIHYGEPLARKTLVARSHSAESHHHCARFAHQAVENIVATVQLGGPRRRAHASERRGALGKVAWAANTDLLTHGAKSEDSLENEKAQCTLHRAHTQRYGILDRTGTGLCARWCGDNLSLAPVLESS